METSGLGGGILEFLVFNQLADEFPARILAFLFAFDLRLLIGGQQFAAFDVHERRGHDEEFAGDFKVEFTHEVNVFDELRGQPGEVDRVNVHFLLFDEVKEQIQRAFKNLELNFVFRHARQPMKNSKTGGQGWQCRKLTRGVSISFGSCAAAAAHGRPVGTPVGTFGFELRAGDLDWWRDRS